MAELLLRPGHSIISYKDTLMVTSHEGWIAQGETGLFNRDTRYLSTYRVTINGFEPRFLGASRPFHFAATFYYTNPRLGAEPDLIPENSLLVRVSRYLYGGLHEDIDIANYSGRHVLINVVIDMDTDFADIFQVRGLERIAPRRVESRWDAATTTFRMTYRNGDFTRTLRYHPENWTSGPMQRLRTLRFRVDLPPGQSWYSCHDFGFEDKPAPGHPEEHTLTAIAEGLRRWWGKTAELGTPVEHVASVYKQAVADLASLRLEEVEGRWFPAAGIPWFAAVFGRDALITGLQTLAAYCPFGIGVLDRLAELQGQRVDRWTEEEPGRLPHELRHGELAATGKTPHTPYYGTVDAPLLYVVLLHELFRFTADQGVLERFYDVATACLDWAARYGDRDGDGFVEYLPLSPKGYRNQGWKDAFDAVVYTDGALVEPPIAICEVQGYYYDALRRMARIAHLLGREQEAAAYRRQADALHRRFDDVFWLPQQGFYAFGLDALKQPIATVASNAGHLLWSGIVPRDKARLVAARLMADDMFSGWGVRTLSAANPAYNPVSYQRGSVWPHDNGLIALGLKRYGFWEEAARIAEGIFATGASYESNSLPEVFAGITRDGGGAPVPYAEANMPQAWAAGSVFMLVQSLLGLEPDPLRRRLVLAPALPDWLPEVTLRNLLVLGGVVDLRFTGRGPRTKVEVLRKQGPFEAETRPGDRVVDPLEPAARGRRARTA